MFFKDNTICMQSKSVNFAKYITNYFDNKNKRPIKPLPFQSDNDRIFSYREREDGSRMDRADQPSRSVSGSGADPQNFRKKRQRPQQDRFVPSDRLIAVLYK